VLDKAEWGQQNRRRTHRPKPADRSKQECSDDAQGCFAGPPVGMVAALTAVSGIKVSKYQGWRSDTWDSPVTKIRLKSRPLIPDTLIP